MKDRRNKWLAVVLVAGLIAALAGCGQKSLDSGKKGAGEPMDGKTTVTIGYLPITHALAVFEAKELLEQEGSEVEIALQKFSSWTDLMDALNAGQIDGASVLMELAMGAVSQGVDLKAVALGHKDGNVIVVSDKIQETKDLKGKTFAIPSNQSSHNILLRDMLANAGLSEKDVTITQLAPTEMPSALASGSVDGYCVAEPFGAQAVVQGYGHVLYDSKEIWENSVCCGFVLNNAFIKAHEKAAQTVVDAYDKAGDSLDQNTDKKKEIAKKYLGQDETTLETSLQWIHYDNLEITKEDYNVLVEKVKEYEINAAPPAYEDFVYQNH